ncbi:unnamed protein product [Closterium sp. Naga37s-1]|nr:unnamed protein product [Closterium sp. Naga37s-1]
MGLEGEGKTLSSEKSEGLEGAKADGGEELEVQGGGRAEEGEERDGRRKSCGIEGRGRLEYKGGGEEVAGAGRFGDGGRRVVEEGMGGEREGGEAGSEREGGVGGGGEDDMGGGDDDGGSRGSSKGGEEGSMKHPPHFPVSHLPLPPPVSHLPSPLPHFPYSIPALFLICTCIISPVLPSHHLPFPPAPQQHAQSANTSIGIDGDTGALTRTHSQHAQGTNTSIGIDSDTGALTDMKELGVSGGEWWGVVREIVGEVCVAPYAVKVQTVKTVIEAACMLLGIDDIVSGLKKKQAGGMCVVWEPYVVKVQTVKTAIEAACMLLRINDIVSGLKKKQAGGAPGGGKPQLDTGDDVDSVQMLAE